MTPTPCISRGLLHIPRGRTPVPQRGQADPPPASPPSPGHGILHVAVLRRVWDKPAGSWPGQEPGTMGRCLAFGDPAPPKEGEEQPSQPRPQLGGVTHPLRAQQQKKGMEPGVVEKGQPPQMRGALPAGARKPRSPHLPHPRLTVPRVGFPVLSGSHRALSPSSQPVPPQGPGRAAAGCPGGLRALGDARQYVWGVRMKSRSSSLRIHFMSLLTALMAPALVPRGL